ncbi:hypothetical protein HKX48_003032 [Thoreauomyces humboldtii]|nr:hypothetical protein HKX48_003032 [Thoreauomyces humboldtii]
MSDQQQQQQQQHAEQAPLLGNSGRTATQLSSTVRRFSPLRLTSPKVTLALVLSALGLSSILILQSRSRSHTVTPSPYGQFPRKEDRFAFLPCTNETIPPALDEADPLAAWTSLLDPDPANWSWGKQSNLTSRVDPYAGRGLFMCGYLDVPLDYTNASDSRIARLAVTKYQPAGPSAAGKSERTIVVNPGGPGGSGTQSIWDKGEARSQTYSNGEYDILGWDPRGVNASLPAASCFPYKADRDRWALTGRPYLESSFENPRTQLQVVDAMHEALMAACLQRLGDFPRFVSTAFVARDLEEIRKALDEEELTAVMFSYGTGIGQTYANMFPDKVGRMVLDGTEYVRDHRLVGGFGWTSLDNTTDAWNDGFLGECVRAGPDHCSLANSSPKHASSLGYSVDLARLQSRMKDLFHSVMLRPIPGYTVQSGPAVLTYPILIEGLYQSMYSPATWPAVADMLAQLERGNATSALQMLHENLLWQYDPVSEEAKREAQLPRGRQLPTGSTGELGFLVICSDSFHAPVPSGATSAIPSLDWYLNLWQNMTTQSFIAGNSRFHDIIPCRHFATNWPFGPAETYQGDLNNTLSNPILLIAEPYDPATPLRNGRRLAKEMGDNARLVVHHGYGHCSRFPSKCTNDVARDYILNGKVPTHPETNCYPDTTPYAEPWPKLENARVDPVTVW